MLDMCAGTLGVLERPGTRNPDTAFRVDISYITTLMAGTTFCEV